MSRPAPVCCKSLFWRKTSATIFRSCHKTVDYIDQWKRLSQKHRLEAADYSLFHFEDSATVDPAVAPSYRTCWNRRSHQLLHRIQAPCTSKSTHISSLRLALTARLLSLGAGRRVRAMRWWRYARMLTSCCSRLGAPPVA